ncbi:hypothetical protein F5148DRAFT_1281153 [Russula earlei]|uniref:Uncharacterized protein n=1 Tax=Russula earlei TaxID=71964 RepID=A0ACC0UHQ2_9AGAM|nr:hypothetical protein F5148DRAFT_1281153 [Russula earlei]
MLSSVFLFIALISSPVLAAPLSSRDSDGGEPSLAKLQRRSPTTSKHHNGTPDVFSVPGGETVVVFDNKTDVEREPGEFEYKLKPEKGKKGQAHRRGDLDEIWARDDSEASGPGLVARDLFERDVTIGDLIDAGLL